MFRPISVYLGIRYTFSFSQEKFISFVSFSALLGLTLGVAILITVASVMNGFDQTIRNQLGSQMQHIQIEPITGKILNWQLVANKVKAMQQVQSVAPYIKLQGVMTHRGQMIPSNILGVQQQDLAHFHIYSAQNRHLQPKKFSVILSDHARLNLLAKSNDRVTLILPSLSPSIIGVMPKLKRFTISALRVHQKHHSDIMGFIRLADAWVLLGKSTQIDGLSVTVQSPEQAPYIALKIRNKLGDNWIVSDWSEKYTALFKAIAMEKTMMIIVLTLLIIMACFSLLSSLVMMVNDKRCEIAILRTMGLSRQAVMCVFITQGMLIGVFGTLLGGLGGWLLSQNIGTLTHQVESLIGRQLVSADVYWVDTLPSQFLINDLVFVIVVALLLCFLATLYPAFKAARLAPSTTLRAHG